MQSNIAMGRYIEDIKDAEEQIKDVLSANPEKEVSKKALLDATTLEQSTIYRATLRLQAKNEIKIIRRGQITSYMIIDPVKIDVAIGGHRRGVIRAFLEHPLLEVNRLAGFRVLDQAWPAEGAEELLGAVGGKDDPYNDAHDEQSDIHGRAVVQFRSGGTHAAPRL